MASKDVNKLFQSFGGNADNYRDFSGGNEVDVAKEKWGLLGRVEIPRVEPIPKAVKRDASSTSTSRNQAMSGSNFVYGKKPALKARAVIEDSEAGTTVKAAKKDKPSVFGDLGKLRKNSALEPEVAAPEEVVPVVTEKKSFADKLKAKPTAAAKPVVEKKAKSPLASTFDRIGHRKVAAKSKTTSTKKNSLSGRLFKK